MKTFTSTTAQSLRDFTDATFPQGSFCFARLLRAKDIKVNGVRVNKNIMLAAGDEVVYYTTARDESAPSHLKVYEDENILVADKYSGVSAEGLRSELCEKGEFFAVHRLDRNTLGLIVFAKIGHAEGVLKEAFRDRGVQKTYLAVCKDGFKDDGATLTAYLKKDAKSAFVKVYDTPVTGGVTILTEYSVVQRADNLALVKINLHTGRTHQIRAHMAHIGCPVLGDNKYGDERLNGQYALSRQCLVAKKIEFSRLSGKLAYLNGRSFESRFSLSFPPIK